jgi:hypothetical protein
VRASKDLTGLHTIFVDYNQAETTQRYLSETLGEDYYHPLYLSRKEDTAAFVAILSESTLPNLDTKTFIRSRSSSFSISDLLSLTQISYSYSTSI